MGFIESSSARELDAQIDLPNSDPMDEVGYELEIELVAEKLESESCFEDDAPDQTCAITAKNTFVFFDFFREQARLAFSNRGNKAYNNNDISSSNDSHKINHKHHSSSQTCLAWEGFSKTNRRRYTGQQPGTKSARCPGDNPQMHRLSTAGFDPPSVK